MDLDKLLSIIGPASGAFLGVRAAELFGRSGVVGVAAGIAGAALGLHVAKLMGAGAGKGAAT